jgi:CBS domain containing-hemolysin-like protein
VEFEGSAPLSALEEHFGVTMDSPGVQTVAGLLIHILGRIPRAGGRFLYRGLEFDVLAATAARVERVAVRPGPVRSMTLDG